MQLMVGFCSTGRQLGKLKEKRGHREHELYLDRTEVETLAKMLTALRGARCSFEDNR